MLLIEGKSLEHNPNSKLPQSISYREVLRLLMFPCNYFQEEDFVRILYMLHKQFRKKENVKLPGNLL
jgi:hypothetical protein